MEIVDRMVQRIRDLSLDLRPPLLDDMGLVTALRGYFETPGRAIGRGLSRSAGDGLVEGLPPEVEIVAFRVVQEAVTNITPACRREPGTSASSSAASDSWLDISRRGRRQGGSTSWRTMYRGPPPGRRSDCWACRSASGMVGGEIEIDSTPGEGTRYPRPCFRCRKAA